MPRSFPIPTLLVSALGLLSATTRAEDLLLRIQQDGNTKAYAISHAQKGQFAAHAAQAETLDGDLLLIGRDVQGQELFRHALRRPSRQRAELFDPKTGRIEHAQDLSRDGAIEVRLPYPAQTASIELQELRQGIRALSASSALKRLSRREIDALAAGSRESLVRATAASGTAMLWDSGPTAARMDLVLIGDGFTSAELPRWQTEARRIADGILADPLFARFKNSFNIRRVDVASAQSGVTEGGVTRNSALGMVIGCYGVARMVCADENKVLDNVAPLTAPDGRDIFLVVANSSTYGGAAMGHVGTMTLHPQSIEVALHEIGHSAFGLADEYDYGSCSNNGEPSAANVTRSTSRATVKWRAFINAATPIPTQAGSVANGTVGLFQGGQYCTSGVYRPTENSRMRALGYPWHAVNEARAQQLFDSYVAAGNVVPSISSQPVSLTVNPGQSASFSVTASSPTAMSYQWRRNGAAIAGATASSYTLASASTADNGAVFSVLVSNAKGSVSSDAATLSVRSPSTSTTVTGSLTHQGFKSYPSGSPGYHQSLSGGTFSANLSGPAAPVDFELSLYKWNGSAWAVVAQSTGPSSQESLSYKGSAGYYYWEVRSYSGAGNFTLTYNLPN